MNPTHNIDWYKKALLILLSVGLLLGLTYMVKQSRDLPGGLSGKWQAVFLTDGQVYFGKLTNGNYRYVSLQDVYYLKLASDLQDTKNLNLIKLGGEAHGPEGSMYIAKDKILFFENLKPTSTVVQAILKNNK